MPLPIHGHHQGETVTPSQEVNEEMGRENIQENNARPTFVRQRSRVEPVEDDSDDTKPQKDTVLKQNGESKSVRFSTSHVDGACGQNDDPYEGIELRHDEETPLSDICDNKIEKCRKREEKKKRKRGRWLKICSCGTFVFLIAACALGLTIYNHIKHNQNGNSPNSGVLYCYPCDFVKPEDIVTYKEEYKMCCVGKNAELKSEAGTPSPMIQDMQEGKGDDKKEIHKVRLQEVGIDVASSVKSDSDILKLKLLSTKEEGSSFIRLTDSDNSELVIGETGLYMLTLTLTTRAPVTTGASGDYYRFLACLKFLKERYQDDECRKITLLPNTGDPFDIHKTIRVEKGTIVRVSVTHKNLLDTNLSFNKLSIVQLHKA